MEPAPQIPVSPAAPVAPATPRKGSTGRIVAIVVVLALIVVGAFYAWGERIAENGAITPEEQQMLDTLRSQGNSTEAAAIEADLEAQSQENFDAELDQAFAEMDAAFEPQ